MQRVILNSVQNYSLINVFKGKLYPQITVICHQRITQFRHNSTVDSSSKAVNSLLPSHDDFEMRHIGPRESDQNDMLKFLGLEVCIYIYILLYLLKHLIITLIQLATLFFCILNLNKVFE